MKIFTSKRRRLPRCPPAPPPSPPPRARAARATQRARRCTPTSSSSGPARAAAPTAAYLAAAASTSLLLEKSTFPREKVCGDGLTPRAAKELISLGVDTTEEAADHEQGPADHRRRPHAPARLARDRLLPRLRPGPHPRPDFDETLARHAQTRGAQLHERTSVTGPVHDAADRVPGSRRVDRRGRVAAPSSDLPRPPRRRRRRHLQPARDLRWAGPSATTAPMGVAVRTYYTTPRHDDDYLESWLELWTTRRRRQAASCCPATAGSSASATARANVGLGILNTTRAFGNVDYKDAHAPLGRDDARADWAYTDDDVDRPDPRRRAADGLQPRTALRRRPAARRRRRRHGQPVQRRGHRLRAWSRGRLAAEVVAQALARADRRRPRAGRCAATRRS